MAKSRPKALQNRPLQIAGKANRLIDMLIDLIDRKRTKGSTLTAIRIHTYLMIKEPA